MQCWVSYHHERYSLPFFSFPCILFLIFKNPCTKLFHKLATIAWYGIFVCSCAYILESISDYLHVFITFAAEVLQYIIMLKTQIKSQIKYETPDWILFPSIFFCLSRDSRLIIFFWLPDLENPPPGRTVCSPPANGQIGFFAECEMPTYHWQVSSPCSVGPLIVLTSQHLIILQVFSRALYPTPE